MKIKNVLLGLSAFLSISISSANATPNAYVTFHTSKNYLIHINNGYTALEMLNYPLALKEFLTAKYIDDELSASYEGLGRVYEITKNYNQSLKNYQKALDLISPKYAQDMVSKINHYRANKEVKNTLALYKIILSIRPEAGLQVLYGDQNKKEKNWQKALVSYQRAYDFQENPQGYLRYLEIKYPNKEYERYLVNKYIQKNLSYPEAHFKAGLVNLDKGNYYNAINEFSKANSQITIPDYENKYTFYLAKSYYKLGVSDINKPVVAPLNKAITYFDKYLKLQPNSSDALFSLANSYFYKDIANSNSFNKQLEQTEKEFEKVQKLPIQDPEYIDKKKDLNNILNKKYNSNFFEKTLETIERIRSLKSYDPGVYYSLGNTYFKKGVMAKGFYDHYKNMNSEKSASRDKTYSYFQSSIEQYKKYINKNPKNNGLVFYDIGLVYYQSSKLDPNRTILPVTEENRKEYERWGPKFYKRDMLGHSIANFKKYLNYYPHAQNSSEISNLMREMQLAMIAVW